MGYASTGDSDTIVAELLSLEAKERALNEKLRQMSIEDHSTGGDVLSLELARDALNRAIRLLDIVGENLNQLEFEVRSPIARRIDDAELRRRLRTEARRAAMARFDRARLGEAWASASVFTDDP